MTKLLSPFTFVHTQNHYYDDSLVGLYFGNVAIWDRYFMLISHFLSSSNNPFLVLWFHPRRKPGSVVLSLSRYYEYIVCIYVFVSFQETFYEKYFLSLVTITTFKTCFQWMTALPVFLKRWHWQGESWRNIPYVATLYRYNTQTSFVLRKNSCIPYETMLSSLSEYPGVRNPPCSHIIPTILFWRLMKIAIVSKAEEGESQDKFVKHPETWGRDRNYKNYDNPSQYQVHQVHMYHEVNQNINSTA